jgi:hypothetical protein
MRLESKIILEELMSSKNFQGKWKIVEMEQWDLEPDFYIPFSFLKSAKNHCLRGLAPF